MLVNHFNTHCIVYYLEVRAQVTLLHCSTTGGWCLQLASISLAVFQYGGVGKQRAHANSHTSNRTAINFSASFSATPTEKRINSWKYNCHSIKDIKAPRLIYIKTTLLRSEMY